MSPHPDPELFDLLPVSVARVAPDCRIEWANARLCRYLGRTPADLRGRTLHETGLRPDGWGDLERAVREVMTTGRPTEYVHYCDHRGGERLVQAKFAPIPGPDGTPAAVLAVAFVNDVLRDVRAALSLSDLRFRAFMDHVPAIAWLRDADQRYLFVNAEYCRLQKIDPSARIGRHITEVFPPAVAAHLLENDALSVAGPLRTRERVPDGEGVVRDWLNVKFTVPGPDGRPQYAGFGLDVSAERKAEADQEALRANLLTAQRAESLGVLAGGVSHDFNNLLTAIMGFAGLARSLAGDGPGQLHECLDQVELAAGRAAELCRQMLAYAGGWRPEPEPVDLSAVARETIRLLAAGHLRGVAVTSRLAADPPRPTGDPTRLRQVVLNLLTNAAEATAGRPERRVWVTTEAAGDRVRLAVRDDGVGMTDEVAARVFEPFFTTKPGGSGLGLAAVEGIVKDHGGTIRLTTAPGEGTTVEVLLPVVPG